VTPLNFVTRWGFAIVPWHVSLSSRGYLLIVPYWFLLLVSGSLAVILRTKRPWRFTLRSLFVLTTFLAVVLGMIAWLDHSWIGK
jgi:hypothetical protein